MMRLNTLHVLGPAELYAVEAAFQAGLEAIDDSIHGLDAYRLRQALARHVIEEALHGERDPERLLAAAVHYLEAVRASSSRGTSG